MGLRMGRTNENARTRGRHGVLVRELKEAPREAFEELRGECQGTELRKERAGKKERRKEGNPKARLGRVRRDQNVYVEKRKAG